MFEITVCMVCQTFCRWIYDKYWVYQRSGEEKLLLSFGKSKISIPSTYTSDIRSLLEFDVLRLVDLKFPLEVVWISEFEYYLILFDSINIRVEWETSRVSLKRCGFIKLSGLHYFSIILFRNGGLHEYWQMKKFRLKFLKRFHLMFRSHIFRIGIAQSSFISSTGPDWFNLSSQGCPW